MSVNRDETPEQAADRAASAISSYIVALAHRVAHGPARPVPVEELEAFTLMRDALRELASHEYDRGFRRAVALRRTPAIPHTTER